MLIVAEQAKSNGDPEAQRESAELITVFRLLRGERPEVLSPPASTTRDKKSIPCFPVRSGSDQRACWRRRRVRQKHHPTGTVAASQMLVSEVCLVALRLRLARPSRQESAKMPWAPLALP